MRPALIVALLVLPLAGCVEDEPPGPTPTPEPTPTPDEPLPDDIEDSRVISGVDAQSSTSSPCDSPAQQCVKYAVSLPRAANIDAQLQWVVPSNDFNLHLFEGDNQLATSQLPAPGTEEAFIARVPAGDYEVWVVPWLVVGDQYELTIQFTSGT